MTQVPDRQTHVRRAILPWIVVGAAAGAGCKKEPEQAPPPPAITKPVPPRPPAPPPCAPIVAPDDGHEAIHVDLDGDHVADTLVPTDCDGRDNCTLHVYLTKGACSTALGDVEGSGSPDVLPLTSRGIALVRTDRAAHASTDETVYAWTGVAFEPIYEGCTYLGPAYANEPCTGAITAAAAQLCLGGAAPKTTLDVDGDGVPDGLYDVPCAGQADSQACGTWVLLARPSCMVAAMVLPAGAVEVVAPAAHGRPARLRVGKHEYRLPAL